MGLTFARRTPDPALQAARAEMTGDEATRVRLAARANTPPAVLRALADDPAITVRAAVAMNASYAPAADRRLLSDADERVRMLLGAKVAALLPGLSNTDQAAAQAHVHRMLHALAEDAAVRVRLTLADALTTMPEAPRAVILKLANDRVAAVSDPILRLSPLLTDADLLELLATPPHDGAAEAVASRLDLAAPVCDHIAHHASHGAVRRLLQNTSAVIQEATLDALAGRAADHPEWHEPLVRRPTLPKGAFMALARMVAGGLVEALAARADLPDGAAEMVRARLAGTLQEPAPPSEADILDSVRRLNESGQLTEAALLDAAANGDRRQVAAILAVASGVTLAALDRAVALRSAKAMISLVWKAGFSTAAAHVVQSVLGQLAPAERVAPPATGFPLSPTEMEWQIELLGEPGR